MYNRIIDLSISQKETCFLWGPRQTGKSTWLHAMFPRAFCYDLLLSPDYRRLLADPGSIRQECMALRLDGKTQTDPIIIDEVQKLPDLLDEVHWLITQHGLRFILSGSSPRSLVRKGGNLLGGRAVRLEMFPLTSSEIEGFSLDRALNHGLLPRHYLAPDPTPLLDAYVGDYLREEIRAESLVRRLPSFQRFLDVAALSNGYTVNFSAIARDLGVSQPTVRNYFDILTDTMLGTWIPAYVKRAKRRVVESAKFYLFDVGVANALSRRGVLRAGSPEYGAAFEHFLFMEIRAYSGYRRLRDPISYWRTSSGFEVDFVLSGGRLAVEVKSTESPTSDHLKGLRAHREEFAPRRSYLVCRCPRPRKTDDGIEIIPWKLFLERLWAGDILG